jgi:catechol 2,3-dioxygenase-like lactoylglutathione lyase family enzyme
VKRKSFAAAARRDVSDGSFTVFTKINHLAIISENYTASAKFYEVMFGMRTSPKTKTERAMSVGDGYLGLNINPRSTGRPARLDHFGVEVDDVDRVFARMRERYPQINWLQRPSSRPFAGITTHDIDGNVFDLSQRDMSNRAGLYAEESGGLNERYVDHLMIRTMRPLEVATFYCDTLQLEKAPAASGDPCHYLTDGHMTLVIAPWSIMDYAGTSITSPCVDHMGFRVGDVDAFLAHVDRVASENRQVAPYPVGSGPEGKARLELARQTCRLCTNYIADVETVLLGLRP